MGADRRSYLLQLIQEHGEPITGTELSQRLGVSRQIIVQDVAVLRAGGQEILATPRGYMLIPNAPAAHRAILAVRHTREQTEDELTIMVDHGLRVLDVNVEHPLYGELRAPLMFSSRSDVHTWHERLDETGASLLSDLTGGVHLHTIETTDLARLERAREELGRRGYLLGESDLAKGAGPVQDRALPTS